MKKKNIIGTIILVGIISVPGIMTYGLIGWGLVLIYMTMLSFYCLQ